MAKSKKTVTGHNVKMPITKLNRLFNDVMTNLDHSTGASVNRQAELDNMHTDIDTAINDQMGSMKEFTGNDVGIFLAKLFNEYDRQQYTAINSIEEIFENDKSGLFDLFKQRYRSKLSLYDDLETISEYLFELGEAINTTRDSILTSDDISNSISYSLVFGDDIDGKNTSESYKKAIEQFQSKFSLLQKIKEHIVPNTLRYGTYYVYTIPYTDLFKSHFDKMQHANVTTMESFTHLEATQIKSDFNINTMGKEKIVNELNSYASNIKICNESTPLPLLEGVDVSALMDADKFTKLTRQATKANDNGVQYNEAVKGKEELEGIDIKDCYIEYLDPRKIIPVKILNKTIGYYYIKELETGEVNKNTFTNTFSINPKGSASDLDTIENQFIGKIASKIAKSLDKKFIEENEKFKELIANALIYNDMYKKKVRFQFIPAKYITEFAVNLDINGEGTSILYPSLFYAKLYLGLLVFKMMSIITKSNDTRLTYIRQGNVDKDIVSQVQSVARSLKQRQMNFTDFMSSNATGLINKVGAGKDVFIPVGMSGEKAIDFDTLAGQDVNLNTDLMEMLRSGYITATGVPSVLMNYINEADYVKTLVMAHSKYVGLVIGHQYNFNHSLTELYKKIMLCCTDIPEEVVSSFKFVLSPPKAANNINMTDLIANSSQIASEFVKVLVGDNSEDAADPYIKDYLYAEIFKEYLPMINWSRMEDLKKAATIKAASKVTKQNSNNHTDNY